MGLKSCSSSLSSSCNPKPSSSGSLSSFSAAKDSCFAKDKKKLCMILFYVKINISNAMLHPCFHGRK